MNGRRVVVTGLGAVTALALDRDEHLRRLFAGESGVARFSGPADSRLAQAVEGRVRGFSPRRVIDNRMLRKLLTPSAGYAVAAAGQALADAAALGDEALLERCGLYVGSICIDIDPEIFIPALKESIDPAGRLDVRRFADRGLLLIDPLFLVKSLPNAGLGGIAIEYGVTGPNLNITNGPVSGLQAVASAVAALRRGEAEIALAGAYDSLMGIDQIGEHLIEDRLALGDCPPEQACRPFDQARAGYPLGEGAAFLVLETEAHARRRTRNAYGEILASAQTTWPEPADGAGSVGDEGLYRAALKALERARTSPREAQAVFGDGLAIAADDRLEASAARRLFGEAMPAYTAATPAIGFTGSAGGAFSLVHAAHGLHCGVVPPLLNCARPDPHCRLNFADGSGSPRLRRALVWNSDRGLRNIAVAIRSYDKR